MRVRGLKSIAYNNYNYKVLSHPMRVRGLKYIFCGKWKRPMSRTPCGCVD